MQIILTSIMVDDQDKALQFYTGTLGFIKKTEVPMGEYKWLTVVSPEGSQEVELLLEPLAFAPAGIYQKQLFDAGIPAAAFGITDIENEYQRLKKLGVAFKTEPNQNGTYNHCRI